MPEFLVYFSRHVTVPIPCALACLSHHALFPPLGNRDRWCVFPCREWSGKLKYWALAFRAAAFGGDWDKVVTTNAIIEAYHGVMKLLCLMAKCAECPCRGPSPEPSPPSLMP